MSLKDQFEEMPEGVESNDVKELRQAMLRLQKQLKQSKERNEDLVFATRQAAYDAMLTFGRITPVPPVTLDKRKAKGEVDSNNHNNGADICANTLSDNCKGSKQSKDRT